MRLSGLLLNENLAGHNTWPDWRAFSAWISQAKGKHLEPAQTTEKGMKHRQFGVIGQGPTAPDSQSIIKVMAGQKCPSCKAPSNWIFSDTQEDWEGQPAFHVVTCAACQYTTAIPVLGSAYDEAA